MKTSEGEDCCYSIVPMLCFLQPEAFVAGIPRNTYGLRVRVEDVRPRETFTQLSKCVALVAVTDGGNFPYHIL